jgi:hypothetical protein
MAIGLRLDDEKFANRMIRWLEIVIGKDLVEEVH